DVEPESVDVGRGRRDAGHDVDAPDVVGDLPGAAQDHAVGRRRGVDAHERRDRDRRPGRMIRSPALPTAGENRAAHQDNRAVPQGSHRQSPPQVRANTIMNRWKSAKSTQAAGPLGARSRLARRNPEGGGPGQSPNPRANAARSPPSTRSSEGPSAFRFERPQMAWISQRSPVPSPSESPWSGFQTMVQLSQLSPMRSPSLSSPAVPSSLRPLQLSSSPLHTSATKGWIAVLRSSQSPHRSPPASAHEVEQTAYPSLSMSGQMGLTVRKAGILRIGATGSLLVISMLVSYVPPNRSPLSNWTSRSIDPPGATVPAIGSTDRNSDVHPDGNRIATPAGPDSPDPKRVTSPLVRPIAVRLVRPSSATYATVPAALSATPRGSSRPKETIRTARVARSIASSRPAPGSVT